MGDEALRCRVMKFGVTSLGSASNILQVLDILERASRLSPLAVVVSAMGQTTDHLIEAVTIAATGDMSQAEAIIDRIEESTISDGKKVFAALAARAGELPSKPDLVEQIRQVLAPLRQLLRGVSIVREKTPQTLDLVMSFGERISASTLALMLRAKGLPAVYIDARDWTVTDDTFGLAKVDVERSRAKVQAMSGAWKGKICIHTGFLGRTHDGRTTTLGRNGSDYTAALVAEAMGRTVNVSGRFLHAIGRIGIMARACAQGVGERSFSAVIDAADTLIVQGAGAGAAVTAAGVLADMLTLAQMLRGE